MSGQKHKLESKTRNVFGRKVKNLRKQGVIPGNVFGKKITSLSIQLNEKEFQKTFNTAGETGLISLLVDGGQERPVLVSKVQVHPVTNSILHVDFHQVDLKEKVNATVPIRITGEAPAVKEKGAIMLHVLSEITVEALPADIPNHFDLSIDGLTEIGSQLSVKDLKVDTTTVTIDPALMDEPIVLIQEARAEEVVETPAEAPVEASDENNATPEAKNQEKST